ncbi:hypothetical protein PPL_00962 [Heterostelium album PN500]|uniref:Uncharacterized protein n=1 Tax=Heterostelium pallidum (strain ATCC 26659 / Pp 5 / PN500) TaxID=670386 RepID=D3AXQ5_HETP5|nr:hypothetical protein PPL_00962 [Heterostelium album PN500]EFA85732.1 hypothetical protein PPL_00962 [Heterostelium album PN500]|eukprot:XP_020437838.1 hypothetical protein PPL_00962 [Heterostelium album PN500]
MVKPTTTTKSLDGSPRATFNFVVYCIRFVKERLLLSSLVSFISDMVFKFNIKEKIEEDKEFNFFIEICHYSLKLIYSTYIFDIEINFLSIKTNYKMDHRFKVDEELVPFLEPNNYNNNCQATKYDAFASTIFYFVKVHQIKEIAIIDAAHVVVRRVDSFIENYGRLDYLNIGDGVAIVQTNFTPTYDNGSKLEVVVLETIYCPNSFMDTVILKEGLGIEVVKVNSTTYRTTIYFSFSDKPEIYFDCYLPIEDTKIYTGGWIKVVSRYGEHYMSAAPTLLKLNSDKLLDKMKINKILILKPINSD